MAFIVLGIVLGYNHRPVDGHWAERAGIPVDFWKMAVHNFRVGDPIEQKFFENFIAVCKQK